MQHVVHVAAHRPGSQHFLSRRERLVEGGRDLLGMRGERDLHEGLDREADALRIHLRGIARDHAGILQPLDAAQAGCRGQPDLLCQRGHGDAPVPLEHAQDAPVGGIEVYGGFRHGHASY